MRSIWQNPKRENTYSQHSGPRGRIVLVENAKSSTSAMITFNSEREAMDAGWIKIKEAVNEEKDFGYTERSSKRRDVHSFLGAIQSRLGLED